VFSFGSSPSFGQTTFSSRSTPFGITPSPFGAPVPAFGRFSHFIVDLPFQLFLHWLAHLFLPVRLIVYSLWVSGSQTASPAFAQLQFANQARGTRIKPYSQTPDADSELNWFCAFQFDNVVIE
jgi:nuclear pore complex protein Nup98-Nup96